MKAAVYRKYGPPEVLRIEDVERPIPADDDVLVRVVASTVCTGDWRLRKPSPILIGWFMNGFRRPKKINILGMEFAGTVDSIGKNVTRFNIGERVFGASWRFGAHAEYACFPERSIAKLPTNASFEEAAAIPYGGVSALYFLKRAGIKAGQRVLIYGASGSVGTAAVQLAKYFGAHVTAVCSTANLGLVRSIGADGVIDYTKEDFSRAGPIYDIIQDTVGKGGFWRSRRALKRGGVFIAAGPGPSSFIGGVWAKITGTGAVIGTVAQGGAPALDFLAGLVEQGKFRPVIDRRYPLADIAEAHRYAEAGHKKGNVVVTIVSNDAAGLSVRGKPSTERMGERAINRQAFGNPPRASSQFEVVCLCVRGARTTTPSPGVGATGTPFEGSRECRAPQPVARESSRQEAVSMTNLQRQVEGWAEECRAGRLFRRAFCSESC